MKTRLAFFVLLFSVISLSGLKAQESYQTAVGLRLGSPFAASIKTFLNDQAALEGYVGWRSYGFGNWFSVSGAYQIHHPIEDVDGLQWYYGFGASAYFWSYDNIFFEDQYSSTSFGFQGYLGLDYKFEDAPVNVTLDWIPTFFLGTLDIGTFGYGYGSLAVRYVIAE